MRYNIGTTSLRLFTNSLHLFNICLHSLFLLYCTGISVAVLLQHINGADKEITAT